MKNSNFIKQILLPTDFSSHSTCAYQFALELAQKSGAGLTLLHVIEPPYNFASELEETREVLKKFSLSRLKELKESKSGIDLDKIEIDTRVRTGMTVPTVLEQIRKTGADLVVMGSKGATGLKKVLFGSIATDIMEKAPIPVLTVPDSESPPKIKKLLFTTDFRKGDLDNLKWLFELAGHYKAGVHALHVTRALDFETEIRYRGFEDYIRDHNALEKLKFDLVENDRLTDGIAGFLNKNPVSIIAINRYYKSLYQALLKKDHTREIIDHFRMPIIVLPGSVTAT